jgi:FdhE protein
MTWAVKCSVSTAALRLFLRTVESVILSKRAVDMKEILAPLAWNRGYCPVCASMPMLAVTREQGQQWLQCSRCSHEWQFARLTCPACDHMTPDDTTYVYVEGKAEEQAFVCENCQKYLITTNQAGSLQAQCPEVLAMSLAHLDLILQDKGYSQMAVCDWNTL